MLIDKRMMTLFPAIMMTSTNIAVFANTFITIMKATMVGKDISENDQEPDALLCMVGIGVGEILGSILFGRVTDNCSHRKTILINVVFTTIAIIVLMLYAIIYDFTWYLSIIMTVSWGFQDSGLNCLLNSLLGFQFISKTTPFCVYQLIQSLTIFICSVICAQIKT